MKSGPKNSSDDEMGEPLIIHFDDMEMTSIGPSSPDAAAADDTTMLSGTHSDRKISRSYPTTIGPYSLLYQIGKGGMGTVWVAEQQQPVKRRVAIKLIRSDKDVGDAMLRFSVERQAIAMMDHQNIARILDAGATDDNSPYFVMELVDGVRLDTYCNNKKLSIRERLELMVPVCKAVQHAHQKGIIHRDLKHSNVLVADYDGKPVPKVIDFGLAKALERQTRLTDETMLTEFGEVVGTLQYMSPEQALGHEVDTRTDIYSLGIMLYKLLTGSTPIQDVTITEQSLLYLLEVIRQKDPPPPSARRQMNLDATETHPDQGKPQKADNLEHRLKGDLDWIVMKALEKDPNRRYETANGLALDLVRYLNDDEVSARPPSTWYRAQKFVKRNRGLVASLSVFALMLVTGIVATGMALVWAIDERDRANLKAIEAQVETKNALRAERNARHAESRSRKLQQVAEAQLHANRMKSAWSDWQIGNVESAWRMLNKVASNSGWESRFLRSEFSVSKTVLYGHAMGVTSVDVSSDGRLIATASMDRTIRIWDAKTGKMVVERIISGAPTCIRFSPKGDLVAVSDLSNFVSIWEVNEEPRQEPKEFGPYPRDIMSFAFCGDNQLILAEGHNDSYQAGRIWKEKDPAEPVIRIVSVDDGTETARLAGHTKRVTAVACTPDGKVIVSSSHDNTVKIWRKQGDDYTATTLSGHVLSVTDVSLSPDGRSIASASIDKTIRLWDVESGSLVHTIVGHTDELTCVSFSRDGRRIVSAGLDRTARLWDLNGKELMICRGHFSAINDLQFSFDDSEIVTASDDQTARVWSTEAKSGTVPVKPHEDVVWAAGFSRDGQTLVSVSEDGFIARLDAQSGRILGKEDSGTALLSVSCSPIADIFVTGDDQCRIRVWNLSDGSAVKTIDAHEGYIWDLTFSPDGRYLVSASADRTAKVWKTEDWSLVTELTDHTGELASAEFSPDGKLLVTSSDDKTVKLWGADTFDLLDTLEGHHNAVWRAVFSPSGKLIASSGYNGEVITWDVNDRAMIRMINGHSNQIAGLAFSASGSRIVTASDDRAIKIWDVESGTEVFVLRDNGDSHVIHAGFSPDGNTLVTANADGWVTIRTAGNNPVMAKQFLPDQAVELATNGLETMAASDSTTEDFERALQEAKMCTTYFPSYRSLTVRGIAEYRFGRFNEAIQWLKKARRLQPIEYGEPDVRPKIEAFLAMSLLRSGKPAEAKEVYRVFEAKRKSSLWLGDPEVLSLTAEVEELF